MPGLRKQKEGRQQLPVRVIAAQPECLQQSVCLTNLIKLGKIDRAPNAKPAVGLSIRESTIEWRGEENQSQILLDRPVNYITL